MANRNSNSEKLRQRVKDYIVKNPITEGERGCYDVCARRFGLTAEQVRRIYRTLKDREGIESNPISKRPDKQFKENVKTGEADISIVTKKRIKTLEDLIDACDIDLTVWDIVSWECNKWEVGRKDKKVIWNVKKQSVKKGKIFDTGKIFVEPLFQVKAKLAKRKIEKDLGLQKEAIIEELKKYSPVVKSPVEYKSKNKSKLLEICIHDLHLGSLVWKPEAGDNYDIKIAETRLKDAVRDLLSRVNLNTVERILFPIGNDLFNIDNKNNSTVNGTVVDTDVRFIKMVTAAKRIIIETIDELSVIAPVDILVVPGNHDFTISIVFGEILEAFYHNNQRVSVNNSPFPRKYYQYGSVGIQLTHGDMESHNNLGLIFATEQPELWAATKFRFSQLGHFHKNKKTNYLSVDEYPGFQIQILPTLSSATAWAASRGYNSLKQAKAFLYDKDEGLQGEFTHTAK
jgi:hypothetical protein